MSWFRTYVRSSIGAKHLMAVTGLSLFVFAIVHMIGHLQMFGGQEMYNGYAQFLQDLWEVKWPARVLLLGLLIVHVVVAIGLVAKNRAARPVGYAMYKPVVSSPLGRAMALTGGFVFAFLAFHILHFTLGQVQPGHFHVMDPRNRWDAYSMFIYGFQNPVIYVVYLVGIALLAMHLGHGAVSWLQSLGLRHPKYPFDGQSPETGGGDSSAGEAGGKAPRGANRLGAALAVGLFVGYMLPPTAVLVGLLKLPGS